MIRWGTFLLILDSCQGCSLVQRVGLPVKWKQSFSHHVLCSSPPKQRRRMRIWMHNNFGKHCGSFKLLPHKFLRLKSSFCTEGAEKFLQPSRAAGMGPSAKQQLHRKTIYTLNTIALSSSAFKYKLYPWSLVSAKLCYWKQRPVRKTSYSHGCCHRTDWAPYFVTDST